MKHIKFFVLILTIITISTMVSWSTSASLDATYYHLSQIHWDGTAHQEGGVTRVGGFFRSEDIEYDYETLMKFDLSAFEDSLIENAQLRVHINGGNVGYESSMQLHSVTNENWDPDTVNYDTFGVTPWTWYVGETELPFAPDGWYTICSNELTRIIQGWADNTMINAGLVLTGNFNYWGYFATIDKIELHFEYTSTLTPEKIANRILSCEDISDWQAASYTITEHNIAIDGQKSISVSPKFPGELPPDNDILTSNWIPTAGLTEDLSGDANIELLMIANEDVYFEIGIYIDTVDNYHHINNLFVANSFGSWQYTSYAHITAELMQLINNSTRFKLKMTPKILPIKENFILDRIFFRP